MRCYIDLLNELYGIDAARLAISQGDQTYGIHTRTTQDSLEELLIDRYGFKPLGRGTFGTVLTHPKLDYVIKIFRNDECYLKFVQMAQRSYNRYFPQFRGKPIMIAGDRSVFGIRMEKLFPATDLVAINAADAYLHNEGYSREELVDAYGEDFVDAIELIQGLVGSDCTPDIHDQNVMRRENGQLVITDPIY